MIKLGENALAAKDFLATVTTQQKRGAACNCGGIA